MPVRLLLSRIQAPVSRQPTDQEVIRPDEGPVLKTGGEFASLVGSSPTASAEDRREGSDQRREPIQAIESGSRLFSLISRLSFGPVVQRRRLLAYIQTTMVRVHPGSLTSSRETPPHSRFREAVPRFDSPITGGFPQRWRRPLRLTISATLYSVPSISSSVAGKPGGGGDMVTK